jgi:hypothetical protein
MNLGSDDSEDEFFGCQSDDNDTTAITTSTTRNYDISVGTELKQQQQQQQIDHQGLCSPTPGAGAVLDSSSHGALSLQESIAQDQVYKNIGYHQAYDRYKEDKLQEGFEAGYRAYIHDAMRLGDLLGQHMMMMTTTTRMSRMTTNSAATTTTTNSCDTSSREVCHDVVETIKNYLLQSQSISNTNESQDDNTKELHDVLNMVQEQLDDAKA